MIPKKMRTKALFMALSRKLRDNELIFLDMLSIEKPKTADAKSVLSALSKSGFEKLSGKKRNAALIALSAKKEAVEKSFRNIGNVTTTDVRNLNPLSVLSNTYLLIEDPKAGISVLEGRAKK